MKFSTYSPDKLKDQVELVNLITKDWLGFGYPNEENLKTSYSNNSSFTPETRHYVYVKEKLVGFISSAVEEKVDGLQYGSIQHPFVHPEYAYVEKEIMEKAIDVLKSKGVTVIRTNFHRTWGNVHKLVEDYNYIEKDIVDKFAMIDLNCVDIPKKPDKNQVREINMKKDVDIFRKLFLEKYDVGTERANGYLKWVSESGDVFSHPVVIQDNSLKAYARVEMQKETNTLYMFHIPCFGDIDCDYIRADIFYYIIEKVKKIILPLCLYLGGEMKENASIYEKFGLKFETVKSYVINIKA